MRYVLDLEYSNDFITWSDIYKEIRSVKKEQYKEKIISVFNQIIKDNDPALAYYFACDIQYQNHQMQNIILETKSPKYALLFAANIANSDIEALQKIVIASKNIKYICQFGCSVPGANLHKIEEMVIKDNNAKYAHMLIKYVKNINLDKFKSIIINSKKPRYLFELAKHLKQNQEELDVIQQLIINSKSSIYIRMFAEKIKTADVEKLEEAILATEDTEEIKKFAKYVKKSKMRNFVVLI